MPKGATADEWIVIGRVLGRSVWLVMMRMLNRLPQCYDKAGGDDYSNYS